jgi:hypothetical protein
MAHEAGHIEDWYKEKGMGGSWEEDSPDVKGMGDKWYLPDIPEIKDEIPLIENFPIENEPPGKFDWLPGVGEYITDDLWGDVKGGASTTFDTVTDMEWDKIIANSVLNSPEMLLDLATFWPQAGMEGIKMWQDKDLPPHKKRELKWMLENKPVIPYEESNKYKEGKGTAAERGVQELGEFVGATQLYRLLYDRAPEMARTIARNWMPWTHGVSTSFGSDLKNYYRKIKKPIQLTKSAPAKVLGHIKNALWSPGTGGALWRAPFSAAAGAGIGTLLHSGPAYGALDDEAGMNYQGSYADRIRDNIDFSSPSPSLIQDRDPAVFDDYVSERIQAPQDERRGPGPWNEFKG